MKFVFFDCDNCYHNSTLAHLDKAAKSKAIEEGFIFVNGKVFCSDDCRRKYNQKIPHVRHKRWAYRIPCKGLANLWCSNGCKRYNPNAMDAPAYYGRNGWTCKKRILSNKNLSG